MSATKSAAEAASGAHRPKRLKIDVACETCRAKKVRCDGARPVCGYCSRKLRLRETCRYSNDDGSIQVQHRSSSDRLLPRPPGPPHRSPDNVSRHNASSAPWAALREVPAPAPHLLRPPTFEQGSPRLEQRPGGGGPSPGSWAGSASTPGSQIPGRASGSATKTSVNTTSPSIIDSMTTAIDEGTSTQEVFGSSSAGSFTSQIKKAIDTRMGRRVNNLYQSEGAYSSGHQTDSAAGVSPSESDVTYVLPSRRQADHLMEQYWFYVDPLYPFLDRNKWQRTYEAIFAGTKLDVNERLFVATLNIVLALSTQLVETLSQEEREKGSNNYLQRAQELQPVHLSITVSVELVQYLLLMAQFLQSTDQPHQTWMVVGSAIRTAQSMGMHLTETSTARSDISERELLRRVWYGCVLMDRMVSVTHGRPPMVSRVLATLVTEPTVLTTNPGPADCGADRVTFFVKSVRLYEIINRIINEVYGGIGDSSRQKSGTHDIDIDIENDDDDLDIVVRLDRCLSKWERRLPDHLKWDGLAGITHAIHRRQTVILRMRYLHARMLLLRPVLSRFCLLQSPAESARSANSLQTRLIEQGALLCVSTAQETIADVVHHQRHDGTIGLLPAWWYRVYYIYTAATILIAARLRPEAFPIAGLARSWSQAMTVLKAHEDFRPSVRRCVAALHILSSKVLQSAPENPAMSGAASRRPSGGEDAAHAQAASMLLPDVEDLELAAQLAGPDSQHFVAADDFAPQAGDIEGLDPADFNFEVNDMSWLHDMHTAWELLNE